MDGPIHIAGHGRSGTTILGQLFEGPGFTVSYEESAAGTGVLGDVTKPVQQDSWQKWTVSRAKAARLVDKEPRNALRLSDICAATGGRGLHIVRDGRDVACSVHAALHKRERTLEHWLRLRTRDQAPGMLTDEEANALLTMPVKVAVGTFWAKLELECQRRHTDAVMVVRYEALVLRPAEEARRIAKHVGADVDWLVKRATGLMADNPQKHTASRSAGNHVVGTRTRRVGRWREQWVPEQLMQLRWLAGEHYARLGYGDWDAAADA